MNKDVKKRIDNFNKTVLSSLNNRDQVLLESIYYIVLVIVALPGFMIFFGAIDLFINYPEFLVLFSLPLAFIPNLTMLFSTIIRLKTYKSSEQEEIANSELTIKEVTKFYLTNIKLFLVGVGISGIASLIIIIQKFIFT